jgi:SAM-dependent methyltransferase
MVMKKYYELHDEFWKDLIEKGHVSWDKESEEEILLRERNSTLSKYLEGGQFDNALDLGCGSGSQSFYLSSLGINCTGIDISQTAINEGNRLAKKLSMDIELVCGDACNFNFTKKFDLITDSCLLHCLVWEDDRAKFFDRVRAHLTKDGRAFIYTMITDEGVNPFDESDYFYFDKEGVLWSEGPDRFDVEWTTINNKKYFPHRRVYSLEKQKQEIISNGFKILSDEVLIGDDFKNKTYVAWIK